MPRYYLPHYASLISILSLSGCGAAPAVVETNTPVVARYADDAAVSEQALKDAIAPFFDDESLSETRAVVIMHGGLIVPVYDVKRAIAQRWVIPNLFGS